MNTPPPPVSLVLAILATREEMTLNFATVSDAAAEAIRRKAMGHIPLQIWNDGALCWELGPHDGKLRASQSDQELARLAGIESAP